MNDKFIAAVNNTKYDFITMAEFQAGFCTHCVLNCKSSEFCRYLLETMNQSEQRDTAMYCNVIGELVTQMLKTPKRKLRKKIAKIRKKVCKKCTLCMSDLEASTNFECVNYLYDQLMSETEKTRDSFYQVYNYGNSYPDGTTGGSVRHGWWEKYEKDKDDQPSHIGTLNAEMIWNGNME